MQLSTLSESTFENSAYELTKQLESLGSFQSAIYVDTNGIPTIGIGFNVRVSSVLDAILEQFGFNLSDPDDSAARNSLLTIFSGAGPYQGAADAVMAARAQLVGAGARSTFEISSESEAKAIYETIIESDYEPSVETFLSAANEDPDDWEHTFEAMALTDLAYNGILSGSPSLRAAIDGDDRAEAWYQISFGSNGDQLESILKRRIITGEVFGLYDDEVGAGWTGPSEDEALKIFRMLNKHEVQIAGELNEFDSAITNAQADWAALNLRVSNATGSAFKETDIEGLDPENWLSGEFAPAADVLTSKYLSALVESQPLLELYANWLPEYAVLANYEADNIFVAAESVGSNQYGHGAEVSARQVDRTDDGTKNDLIFSGIAPDSSVRSYVLNGGQGNDLIVLGEGSDDVDGGDGVDGISLARATSGQILDLDEGIHAGSVVAGDTFTNIEYIIGSDFGDTVTFGEDAMIFFGGAGNDTINGGDGDDTIFAGGASGGANTIFGGAGYDEIVAGAGVDIIDGGIDEGIVNYILSTAGVTLAIEDGIGLGSGGFAEDDEFENIQGIVGSQFADTVFWAPEDSFWPPDSLYFDGFGGDDQVHSFGNGDLLFYGGDGEDQVHIDLVDFRFFAYLGDDGSDRSEDRVFIADVEISFDFDAQDFIDGQIGEYLSYGEANGGFEIFYSASVDGGVLVPDGSSERTHSIYVFLDEDGHLHIDITDSGQPGGIVFLEIPDYEQGDFGFSFEFPDLEEQEQLQSGSEELFSVAGEGGPEYQERAFHLPQFEASSSNLADVSTHGWLSELSDQFDYNQLDPVRTQPDLIGASRHSLRIPSRDPEFAYRDGNSDSWLSGESEWAATAESSAAEMAFQAAGTSDILYHWY